MSSADHKAMSIRGAADSSQPINHSNTSSCKNEWPQHQWTYS